MSNFQVGRKKKQKNSAILETRSVLYLLHTTVRLLVLIRPVRFARSNSQQPESFFLHSKVHSDELSCFLLPCVPPQQTQHPDSYSSHSSSPSVKSKLQQHLHLLLVSPCHPHPITHHPSSPCYHPSLRLPISLPPPFQPPLPPPPH